MKRVILFLISIFFSMGYSYAQYDALITQYFSAMGYYNPAHAGSSGDLNMLGLHRQQWIGHPGAPKSFFITADMPLQLGKTNHGVGVAVFTEKIGLFQNTHMGGQYAYKQKLLGGTLSVGLQVGIVNTSFDIEKIFIPTTDFHQQPTEDEAIPVSEGKGMGFDLNAGIYYTHKNFYVGLASMHLTEPQIQLEENIYTYIPRSYNLGGGYNIQLKNPLYELQPSVMMMTDMTNFMVSVTGRMVYNKMFNGGISWRVNESVSLLLGASFKGVEVGYAYDYPISAISKVSSGSHEVMIRFGMKLKKTKTGLYKHKSVRIL